MKCVPTGFSSALQWTHRRLVYPICSLKAGTHRSRQVARSGSRMGTRLTMGRNHDRMKSNSWACTQSHICDAKSNWKCMIGKQCNGRSRGKDQRRLGARSARTNGLERSGVSFTREVEPHSAQFYHRSLNALPRRDCHTTGACGIRMVGV